MPPTRGKLFVFEGLDGVGKSTLSAAFASSLASFGHPCISLSFPGREPRSLGAWVYDLHHSYQASLRSLSPTSLQALHVAAHIDAIEGVILPALTAGTSVVLDRYWWSTWAYGRAQGAPVRALNALIRVEALSWRRHKPDCVFLVQRAAPTGATPSSPELTPPLQRAYEVLRRRESAFYKVHSLPNDDTVAEVTARAMALAGFGPGRRSANRLPIPVQQSLALPNSARPSAPDLHFRLAPAKPTVVFDSYWRFAAERQEVFFRRLRGDGPPWTVDRVLARHKFTNAYRASDRVSQFLIREVMYGGNQTPEDLLFRTLLFKLFNKIETWHLLENEFGTISYSTFSAERFDRVLLRAQQSGSTIYSGAYIMPTGGKAFPPGPKHRMHLKLLDRMMKDGLPEKVFSSKSLKSVFELLRSYPTIGDFLAYQFSTDLNYSGLMPDLEGEFVVPGPGARDGIRKCFSDLGGLSESELIKFVADRQEAEFDRLGLAFRSLWGRRLQLIDCQNLFCETDKYARVMHPEFAGFTGRTRIKQVFQLTGPLPPPWYPPKWGLNDLIQREFPDVPSSCGRDS